MPELNAIGIVASDLGRSVTFYRLLGVDLPEDCEGHIEATLPAAARSMLDARIVKSSTPTGRASRRAAGSASRSLREPGRGGRAVRACESRGFDTDKEPWDAFWGQRYAQLRDPDGVPIDLYAPL